MDTTNSTEQKLSFGDAPYTQEGQENRLNILKEKTGTDLSNVAGIKQFSDHEQLQGNIENFIGMAQVPIGVAGPLCVQGSYANGEFYVPLATTEGALVASYNRGMKACCLNGGIRSMFLYEGVQRSPYFKFHTIEEAQGFLAWIYEQTDAFNEIVSKTSRFAELKRVKPNIEGNSIILTLSFRTGDAAGQNMVTICSHAICTYIAENTPVKPTHWYIESNFSGDKKATAHSFNNVRGKKVSAEVVLSKESIEQLLKTSAQAMADYWRASTLAVLQSGAIGAQGHIANALTALFLACGQDVACISESAVGVTRMEVTENDGLYVSVTLPNLIVGTVGGGTNLPTQRECLELIGCHGNGQAKKFAEICAALALCGEVSIAAAMAADHFASAHENLGRNGQQR